MDEMYGKSGMGQTKPQKDTFFVVYLTVLSVFVIDIPLGHCIQQHDLNKD
jgi:hypothetical protein